MQGRPTGAIIRNYILDILLKHKYNLYHYLYSDFYAHLETEINEKCYWDQESQSKAQGLFSSCRRYDRLVVFIVLFNVLEPLKPLVTKLQRRNQKIYHVYHMIDQVISDLKDTKRDIENEFKG